MAEKVEGKLGKWSLIMGVIGVILALLPFASAWFLLINWLVFIFAGIGALLGIFGYMKNQKRALAGIIASVIAIAAYFMTANCVADNAVKGAANAIHGAMSMASSYSEMGF